MTRHHLRDLARVHEHAPDLGGLVGPAHPALDADVGAARGRARQHRREVAGAEADQRISGFSVVTTTSPTSPSATGSPVPGRTIRRSRLRR